MRINTTTGSVCCAAIVIGMAGCSGVSGPSQSTPTPTTSVESEESQYNLGKLTDRLNESMSTLEESESMVIGITVEEGLSEREFNETVAAVENRTVNFRSAFMNERLITARATADQIRGLTTLDRVERIDIVESGASN